MTKKEFRDRIKKSKLILDGATGSNLQKRGMPVGVCPEEWIIENSEVLKHLQPACGLFRSFSSNIPMRRQPCPTP